MQRALALAAGSGGEAVKSVPGPLMTYSRQHFAALLGRVLENYALHGHLNNNALRRRVPPVLNNTVRSVQPHTQRCGDYRELPKGVGDVGSAVKFRAPPHSSTPSPTTGYEPWTVVTLHGRRAPKLTAVTRSRQDLVDKLSGLDLALVRTASRPAVRKHQVLLPI